MILEFYLALHVMCMGVTLGMACALDAEHLKETSAKEFLAFFILTLFFSPVILGATLVYLVRYAAAPRKEHQ